MRWPAGFASAATAAGLKQHGEPDLGLIVADHPVSWAGTFTRNAAAAASVEWCRSRLGRSVRAVVCNSGNANACTGEKGRLAVENVAVRAASSIGCGVDEVLIASTGPIGVALPVELITAALPSLTTALGSDADGFAHAILTTDSKIKTSSASAGDAMVVGVAKGAAMLAPNMATMLAFLATDAHAPDLQTILEDAVRSSFDRICVDACESTNDSVILLSGGKVATTRHELAAAVAAVCKDLAEQMVRDAEGASRFVRIHVTGAGDDETAAQLGRAVAASALWRAAVNGGDPNWGRVLAALGAADRTLDLEGLSLALGPETVFDRGEPVGCLESARAAMATGDITISCVVGRGQGTAEILSTDLSADYVLLNADGST